jgi:uncharacterized membrane protein YvbJ
MFCTKCGAENEESTLKCVKCGEDMHQEEVVSAAPQQNVPNYLVWAILSTLFCCLPFGIVSIVFAAQVNDKLTAGDTLGAIESSNKAKMWAWISFGVGAGVTVLSIIGMVVPALLAGVAGVSGY